MSDQPVYPRPADPLATTEPPAEPPAQVTVPVELPAPDELRNRWAASAAVLAALDFADGSQVRASTWHYDDGGGNWVELALLPDGRGVLYGFDHEYSDTYFGAAATYFDEPETDLLAGAPDWWATPLPQGEGKWIGFVYGYEGGSWRRAPYDLEDGFGSVNLPALSDDALVEHVSEFIEGAADDAGVDHAPDHAAILAIAVAGPQLTRDQLAAVLGPLGVDLDAGVEAARSFG